MRLGFIGLGTMRSPMASDLIAAGHEVTAYSRTRSRAENLGPLGAKIAGTPGEPVQGFLRNSLSRCMAT
jgi:3-hydroxyisobutyrate dehydrogenase-like beta-hydroxyacid dehydrogenase